MKKLPLFLLLLATQLVTAQSNFKVVGYLPTYRFSWLNDIEFERLTHVNIAFANPDMQGNLSFGTSTTNAVNLAHQHGCKVFACIGGGYLTQAWEDAWDTLTLPANRAAYIQKIVQFAQTQGFDGIDVDLEWQYVKDWYSPFIIELKAALQSTDIQLTAAFPGSYRYPKVNNEALAAFDWVNMMVYDLKGPWDPNNPGQHSPYSWAVQCIAYWQNQGVSASKLTLGVPFYGYDFGVSPVASFTYRTIVGEDPANAQLDELGQKFWNGIPTIIEKTELALNNVAGIMIWEIGQDAFGANAEYSLLRAIDNVVDAAASGTKNIDPIALKTYPNPANNYLAFTAPNAGDCLLRIFDMQGNIVQQQAIAQDANKIVSVTGLPSGIYTIMLQSEQRNLAGRFVKI